MDIARRSAVVSGGTSGPGAAVVRALRVRGAVAASRELTAADATVSSIADVTDEATAAAIAAIGPIRRVFNCAG